MMNRETYLNELAQALRPYDKAYVDEIISDYDAHFENAVRQGKSEADICEELGSVGDVIAEIKELLGEEKLKSFVPARPDAPIGAQENNYSYENDGSDFDEAYNGGSSDEKVIRSFAFCLGSADMRLIPSEDNQLRVYTEDKDENIYIEQSVSGGCYKGQVAAHKSGFLGIAILAGVFGGPVDTVIAQIPASVENIEIQSTSGDIFIKQISAENIAVHTTSGDISAKKTESRKLEAETVSGDTEFKHVRTEVFQIHTTSGDVRYEDVIANEFSCRTTSGDLNGRKLEGRSVFVKTVSGDASVNLKCYDEKFYAYAKSVSGSVRVKGGFRVDESDFSRMDMSECIKAAVETVSGDVRIKAEK